MRKHRIVNILVGCAVAVITVLPMLLGWKHIQITKYSIPAICTLAIHLLYGLMACIVRHKGNYLRLNFLLFRHFLMNLFLEPDKDYTFTKEYKKHFNRMLAVYFAVVPMYIPCIFLTSTAAAMPLALLVFLFPHAVFIAAELRGVSDDIKEERQKNAREKQERMEQERREEFGKWK